MKVDNEGYMVRKLAKEINIRDYFLVIKKGLWIIALITIISSTAGYLISNNNTELLYETSTRIIIGSDSGYMNTLMVMIKDPIVLEKAKEDLQLTRSAETIASQVDVSQIDDSQVIRITVTDPDPELAAAIANTIAKSYKEEVIKILDFDEVQLLSAAKANNYPINESNNRIQIITIVFGLVAGIGLVFLLDTLDTTISKGSEVESILGVPVIGVISNMNKKKYFPKKRKQKEMELRGETVGSK